MRSLTGRVQHRVHAELFKPALLVLQVEVRPTHDEGPDPYWRDAKVEDLAHLPDLYNVNKESKSA